MKIGIPRSLFYYRFISFWEKFFTELGAEVVVSEQTNKRILDDGVKACVDEACLPIKLFYGHVINLRNRVDYILVPRFTSISKKEYICPEFGGLPDMIRHTLKDLPGLIDTEVNMRNSKRGGLKAAIQTGAILGVDRRTAVRAYKSALDLCGDSSHVCAVGDGSVSGDGSHVYAVGDSSMSGDSSHVYAVGDSSHVYAGGDGSVSGDGSHVCAVGDSSMSGDSSHVYAGGDGSMSGDGSHVYVGGDGSHVSYNRVYGYTESVEYQTGDALTGAASTECSAVSSTADNNIATYLHKSQISEKRPQSQISEKRPQSQKGEKRPQEKRPQSQKGEKRPQEKRPQEGWPQGRHRIAVIGHPYNIYDRYISMDLLGKLAKYGIEVRTIEMVCEAEINAQAEKLEKPMFWNYGRMAYGAALHLAEAGMIEGFICVTSFGCGIDSFVNDLIERNIRRKHNIPFITMTIDEHSGEAGFNTRLEAFVDMLGWRNRNENHISASG